MRKQQELYGEHAPFTAFDTVGPDTDLSQLDLNWREQDLPQHERTRHVHGLHPYLGKFIPQLVEIFLRKYARESVVDPFAGSGTTLVEANRLGFRAMGCDVSAFNCLLARVKTARYDLALLRREMHDVLARTEFELFKKSAAVGGLDGAGDGTPEVPARGSAYLRRWYAPQALAELLTYRSFIPQYHYQDVLKLVLSRAARSARLTTHFELDFPAEPQTTPYYCRKHHRICSPTTQALAFLRRYTADTLRRIEAFAAVRTQAPVEVVWGDARDVRFPPCDTVVTSPPYPGLIDYHEQHRYAYELLGLPGLQEREIGRPNGAGGRRRLLAEYYRGIADVFANVAGSVRPGGHVIIVVHDRDDAYVRLAGELGWEVESVLTRHVNRRTGLRSGEFFERVYVWRKPDGGKPQY
ncbi:DNA methyltransferase [Carboxydochorda subterranea]|uniref:site-specific DNA-methyltransferase (cytosine-N(4)-specific) n=1 Tax=Carboxydichorda subterranea TaxID=3109565 RepID=A0ABZ1BVL3_9FIRM|nr:DNA methyltransferase [Limnochorda sp. L945t]WRP16177.1 DNA methyltransferase [Limnochorda sp. L945t]